MNHLRQRPRRLRADNLRRELLHETRWDLSQIMTPLFVSEGSGIKKPLKGLPGNFTLSLDELKKEVKTYVDSGIKKFLLFGVTNQKDEKGSYALKEDGIVPIAIKELKNTFPEILIGTDIALDPYTSHGHDGLFEKNSVLNDETVEVLTEMALLHAEAGADMVAPSDMMDGRIGFIRNALETTDHKNILIMAYTAKYASALYGPFREILDANVVGDKKSYQMSPANRREALRELDLDQTEGADIVMVKPATWYLDIISDFKKNSRVPVAAYHVSGEAAMIEAAAAAGTIQRERAIGESTLSIFRAGADIVITYFGKDLISLSRAT